MPMKLQSVNLKTFITSVSAVVTITSGCPLQLAAELTKMNNDFQAQGYTNIELTDYEDKPLSIKADRLSTHTELDKAREKQTKWFKLKFEDLLGETEYEVESMTKSLQQTADDIPKLQQALTAPGVNAVKVQEQQKQIDFILAKLPARQAKLVKKEQQLQDLKVAQAQGVDQMKEYMLKTDPTMLEVIEFKKGATCF
jgi:hypothetical protein